MAAADTDEDDMAVIVDTARIKAIRDTVTSIAAGTCASDESIKAMAHRQMEDLRARAAAAQGTPITGWRDPLWVAEHYFGEHGILPHKSPRHKRDFIRAGFPLACETGDLDVARHLLRSGAVRFADMLPEASAEFYKARGRDDAPLARFLLDECGLTLAQLRAHTLPRYAVAAASPAVEAVCAEHGWSLADLAERATVGP